MRNIHYKAYSFRLNELTMKKIKEIKIAENISYNLLFVGFLNQFNKRKKYDNKKTGSGDTGTMPNMQDEQKSV